MSEAQARILRNVNLNGGGEFGLGFLTERYIHKITKSPASSAEYKARL